VGLLVAAGIAWQLWKGARGHGGEAATESVAVGPFSGVLIEGTAEATLVPGNEESVTVALPAHSRAPVKIDIADGILKISHRRSSRWWDEIFGERPGSPRITVRYRNLASVSTEGAVKLTAAGMRSQERELNATGAGTLNLPDLQATRLSVAGSGAVKATLSGRVETQTIRLSGAADYRAPQLVSRSASVHVSGAGRVVVNAERTLDVSLSGASNVEYLGTPQLTQHVSGVGRVKRREPSAD
jgi:hypothetical protein